MVVGGGCGEDQHAGFDFVFVAVPELLFGGLEGEVDGFGDHVFDADEAGGRRAGVVD